ncbi:hypothetical protein [Streptomyces sp. NPDC046909]|uniref:hypothetical protein n=1 Tax=Streptomyces sp. NPDC046909 TaxID=3155617 RepID=UPI00340C500B
MGEGQSGGGASGRRRVHPGGAGSPNGAGSPSDAASPTGAELETLLAAAMRETHDSGAGAGAAGEQQAVAAFRAARDAGAHRAPARTRRRDDWRPREQRRLSRSLKATLSVFVASLTLGGVAFAAIGTVGSSSGTGDQAGPHTSAPARPTTTPSADASAGSSSGASDRPVTAQDTEAHCRAYEHVSGRGNALNSTAWQRLVEAAGGESKVAAYCAEQLEQADQQGQGKATQKPDSPGKGATKSSEEKSSEEKADKASGKDKQ